MVCKHVNEVFKKLSSLGDEVRGESSPLYGGLGPYVKYETANEYMNTMVRWANEVTGKGDKRVEFFKQNIIDEMGVLSPFFVKTVDKNVLRERVLEIDSILKKCNCVDMGDAVKVMKEKFCEVEVCDRLRNELREKEKEIRELKEKLKSFETSQRFEARQEYSSYGGNN